MLPPVYAAMAQFRRSSWKLHGCVMTSLIVVPDHADRGEQTMNRRRFLGVTGGSIAATLAGGHLAEVLAQTAAGTGGPVIETHTGKIRGVVDQGVRIFRGVPYG